MSFNRGDRVRPSAKAVHRDRHKPTYDHSKRTPHMVGTIVGVTFVKSRNTTLYTVRWETQPGSAFSYFEPGGHSANMLQLYEEVERE